MTQDELNAAFDRVFTMKRHREGGDDHYLVTWDFAPITGNKQHILRHVLRLMPSEFTSGKLPDAKGCAKCFRERGGLDVPCGPDNETCFQTVAKWLTGKPLTPYEWLFALALNLERGKIDVLDGFRTQQFFIPDRAPSLGGSVTIVWELLGEKLSTSCRMEGRPRPETLVNVAGNVRELVIKWALDTLNRHITAAIAARSQP